jgi:Fanconi anemia group M protein
MTFLDIFSKKPTRKKKKKKVKITIDYRERNCLIPSELASIGLEIEFKELKVADYIVKGTAIERKTVNDFISSMINKRLLKQLEEIQQYESRLLIIEGIDEQELYSEPESKELTGMNPNAIRGFLLSILLKYNVPIIYTKNYKDTAKFISVLSKKQEKELPLNITKKTLNKKERLQFVLESFPGIGPKTAKKLLKRFKTLRNIFNASEEELKEVLGKKAESFKDIIYRKY